MTPEVEKEARWLTWRAWLKRDRGRLFDPGPPLLRNRAEWDRADDMYWGKAVGIMPDVDQDPDSSSDIVVGEWRGFGAGLGGISLQIRAIGHHGVTTHRSPLNVGFIYILPTVFQRLVDADWRDNEDREGCTQCVYTFKPGEYPCDCQHENGWFALCGLCCYSATVYEERGYDRMLDQMTGVAT